MEGELAQIGKNVRAIRKERGLTQQVLAERADLSVDMLGGIERGVFTPSLQALNRIAVALEVPLEDLVRLEEGSDELALLHRLLRESGRPEDPVLLRRVLEVVVEERKGKP